MPLTAATNKPFFTLSFTLERRMNPLPLVMEVFHVTTELWGTYKKRTLESTQQHPVWDLSREAFLKAAGLTQQPLLGTAWDCASTLSRRWILFSGTTMEQYLNTVNMYCSHC